MTDKILLVEDNMQIQKANQRMLELHNYQVYTAFTIEEARALISLHMPSLIVLDIMMPDESGLDFCVEIRSIYPDIPILFLTALGENADVISGLRIGGDDYLAKPYDYEVLLARIEALLRRSKRSLANSKFGSFFIDHTAHRVYKDNRDILLKPREFLLFQLFAENIGVYLSSNTLYKRLWVGDSNSDLRTVYAHISSLRKKLDAYGNSEILIELHRGKGYRMILKENGV